MSLTSPPRARRRRRAWHLARDGALSRRGFHPEARIASLRDGACTSLTCDELAARFSGVPAEDESLQRRRSVELDLHGSAGAAKVELDAPGAFLVDSLSLLRVGPSEWQIVRETFHCEARASRPRP